ncbi:hypothetical protein EV359DRAFT_44720 [Lentinula novae-zelandiae]|nr:hypothetical protein EV359DRAFT_44720 [Lentinula novae-zelandiae]
MWPAPNERKIYVMYGSADRLSAVKHAPGGADIDSQKWGRERLRGNHPEPKQPARGCENVLWVPSCGSMNTIKSKCNMQKGSHTFTFFGDTFLSSIVRPGIWVILTVTCNPDTGKIYLFRFGGVSTTSDFIPTKSLSGRVYNDVWQLKINTHCFSCGNCNGAQFLRLSGLVHRIADIDLPTEQGNISTS